ncbi:MAG TPA: type I-E CRISPR-associated protein Cas6/Cse3/CasE [Sedimentisphaerales bacterium]|nr:type I-E CRISPR-associated protein Cas6/Cse3/CasE [Sedimentisphaerales bacterium]
MFRLLLYVDVKNEPGRRWLRDIYRVHQRLWMMFPDDEQVKKDEFFLGAWKGPALEEPNPNRRKAGFLFRIEQDGKPRILVQSVERPNWQYAFQNAPYLLAKEPKYEEFEYSAHCDKTCRFRLLANVVRSKSVVDPNGRVRTTHKGGHTIPIRRRTEVVIRPNPVSEVLPCEPVEREKIISGRWDPWREWLKKMGRQHGFEVLDNKDSPLLMEGVHVSVRKPSKNGAESAKDKAIDKHYNGGLFNGKLVCSDPEKLRNALINGVGHGKAFGFGLLSVAPVK